MVKKVNSGLLLSWKWSTDPSISMSVTSLLYLCESINSFLDLLLCVTGISRIIYCSNSGIQPHQRTVSKTSIATGFPKQMRTEIHTARHNFHIKLGLQVIFSCESESDGWKRKSKEIWGLSHQTTTKPMSTWLWTGKLKYLWLFGKRGSQKRLRMQWCNLKNIGGEILSHHGEAQGSTENVNESWCQERNHNGCRNVEINWKHQVATR